MNLLPPRWLTALLLVVAGTAAVPQAPAAGELLRFRYSEGDMYRIVSTSNDSITLNGVVVQETEISNRQSIEVTRTRDGRGFHQMTAATLFRGRISDGILQLGKEYRSEFWRDERGYYEIDDQYEQPSVQDVPIFPEGPVSVGQTWSFPGREVINVTEALPLTPLYRGPTLVRIESPVAYRLESIEDREGDPVAVVALDFSLHHRPTRGSSPDLVYPILISGEVSQTIYWSLETNRLVESAGVYTFTFVLATGDVLEYNGSTRAEVIDSRPLDRENVRRQIEDDLRDRGVEDAEVTSDERGVTITLDNVQFPPDSAVLIPREQEKLRQIGEILRNYPANDILVSGHTALAGTPEGRQRLSEQRAAAVGAFLIDEDVREPDRILYQGFGARRPVADNSTPEGMRKNRRVEITILEN